MRLGLVGCSRVYRPVARVMALKRVSNNQHCGFGLRNGEVTGPFSRIVHVVVHVKKGRGTVQPKAAVSWCFVQQCTLRCGFKFNVWVLARMMVSRLRGLLVAHSASYCWTRWCCCGYRYFRGGVRRSTRGHTGDRWTDNDWISVVSGVILVTYDESSGAQEERWLAFTSLDRPGVVSCVGVVSLSTTRKPQYYEVVEGVLCYGMDKSPYWTKSLLDSPDKLECVFVSRLHG